MGIDIGMIKCMILHNIRGDAMMKTMNVSQIVELIGDLFVVLPAFPYRDEHVTFNLRRCGNKVAIREARLLYQERHNILIKTRELKPQRWWWYTRRNRAGVTLLLDHDMMYWEKYQTLEAMYEALTTDEDLRYHRSVEARLHNEDKYVRAERKKLMEGRSG